MGCEKQTGHVEGLQKYNHSMQRCDKGQGTLGIGSDKDIKDNKKGFTSAHQQQKEYQGKYGATAELGGCPDNRWHRDAIK